MIKLEHSLIFELVACNSRRTDISESLMEKNLKKRLFPEGMTQLKETKKLWEGPQC